MPSTDHNSSGFIFLPDVSDAICEALPQGIFGAAAPHLKNSGKGLTKLLYSFYKTIDIEYPVLNQGTIGTCTSFGIAAGVDVTKVADIANGERSSFVNITATEPIYHGARKLGGWRIPGDGASVALGIKYVHEYGTIARGVYNKIDLSNYSIEKSRSWGNNRGFPKEIEVISKDHCIEQYSRVKSYEEARDSIANDCPVVVGSSYGYSSTCDNDGIAKQNTTWGHCMVMIAIRGDKDLILIANSWGPNWNKMPVRKYNEPKGSFWVTAENAHKMCANGDAWSISAHKGYPLKVNSEVVW